MITITVRDINGKRHIIKCENGSEVIELITDNVIDDDYEILIVAENGLCLYSALASDHPITLDDLTGFFG